MSEVDRIVIRRCAPSNCDLIIPRTTGELIAKMAGCEVDVEVDLELENDKQCAYEENQWRLTLTTMAK